MKTTFDTQGLQSVLDGQLALGFKAVEAIEQLGALQVKTTKALMEQAANQQAALLGTKSPQELAALASGASEPLAKISLINCSTWEKAYTHPSKLAFRKRSTSSGRFSTIDSLV